MTRNEPIPAIPADEAQQTVTYQRQHPLEKPCLVVACLVLAAGLGGLIYGIYDSY